MPDRSMIILEKMMDIASYRRHLLASNIANADTPGYKAKDISFKREMSKALGDLEVGRIDKGTYEVFETFNTMPNRDGNTVNVDIEMAKIAENSMTYNTAVQLFGRRARMLRDALKSR